MGLRDDCVLPLLEVQSVVCVEIDSSTGPIQERIIRKTDHQLAHSWQKNKVEVKFDNGSYEVQK